MGHVVNADRTYRLLQQQLDRSIIGAPESPVLDRILRILFHPADAEIARQLPGRPTPVTALAQRMGVDCDRLFDTLSDMAVRGLVVDLEHAGVRYFSLAPVVIGFFEFTFMRARDELPTAELARLFDEYMTRDEQFAQQAFRGQTQIGRSLVHEEALPESDHTEILDWERASHIVKSATAIGVSTCACRHKAEHNGEACSRLQRCCLTFNYAAESMVRNGIAEPIDVAEAMRILAECKQAGLAQTGDNVQRKVTYICNCCGCCCEMVRAIRTHNVRGAIVTSNWVTQIDTAKCKGCGKCAKACPVEAIAMHQRPGNGKPRKQAVLHADLCLGCGVCYAACKSGAISMTPRDQRVFTPDTVFDRVVAMAIERGKLAEMVFDDPQKLSHRALGRIVGMLERSPLFRAAMAVKPLRSAFFRRAVSTAKKQTGPITEILE